MDGEWRNVCHGSDGFVAEVMMMCLYVVARRMTTGPEQEEDGDGSGTDSHGQRTEESGPPKHAKMVEASHSTHHLTICSAERYAQNNPTFPSNATHTFYECFVLIKSRTLPPTHQA